jgi:hypothetical protein
LGGLNEPALFKQRISLFREYNIALRCRLQISSSQRAEEPYLDEFERAGVFTLFELRTPDITVFVLDQDFKN